MIPEETLERAVDAFHQALSTHIDHAGATSSRGCDWMDVPITAVVEALLLSGWVGPQDDSGEPGDLELAEQETSDRYLVADRGGRGCTGAKSRVVMADSDLPPRTGNPMLLSVPAPRERRQYYLVVVCGDGYEHEILASDILDLYMGRARGTYSPLCGRLVQPETSPSLQAWVRCIDCARRRAAIAPEPVWWGDPRPLLQALTHYFAHYGAPSDGIEPRI
jgi:hypothetical protein